MSFPVMDACTRYMVELSKWVELHCHATCQEGESAEKTNTSKLQSQAWQTFGGDYKHWRERGREREREEKERGEERKERGRILDL